MRKSKVMLAAEERVGEPLETYLPRAITELGIKGTCEALGISTGTVTYWQNKFGVVIYRVAIGPGERVIVVDKHGNEDEIGRVY